MPEVSRALSDSVSGNGTISPVSGSMPAMREAKVLAEVPVLTLLSGAIASPNCPDTRLRACTTARSRETRAAIASRNPPARARR